MSRAASRLSGRFQGAFESLLLALFPPRCAACDQPLATRPPFLLCDSCHEVLEPNLGARCLQCDLPRHAWSGPEAPTKGVERAKAAMPDASSPTTAEQHLPAAGRQSDRCHSCNTSPPAFVRSRAPFVYGGGLADMIAAAKFRGREELAAAAGRLLAADNEARTLIAEVAAVVPVPLGQKRRRQRGYNQAAVIARALGRAHRRPVLHALRRARETPPQSELPLLSRAANVNGAFAPLRQVSGRMALVDDVVTSGQTACAAAQALLEAGASDVVVLAVARAV